MGPLWGKFNGKVENLTPNIQPPYLRVADQPGPDAGARPLLNVGSLGTWASKFGRENIVQKMFSTENCKGKSGRNFQGKRGVTAIPFQFHSVGEVSPFSD